MQATQPIRTVVPPKSGLVALIAAALLGTALLAGAVLAPTLGLGTNAGGGSQPEVTEFHRSFSEIYGSGGGITEFHRSFAEIYQPAPLTLDRDAAGAGQRGAGAKVAH